MSDDDQYESLEDKCTYLEDKCADLEEQIADLRRALGTLVTWLAPDTLREADVKKLLDMIAV